MQRISLKIPDWEDPGAKQEMGSSLLSAAGK